jgi:hypothetical protein
MPSSATEHRPTLARYENDAFWKRATPSQSQPQLICITARRRLRAKSGLICGGQMDAPSAHRAVSRALRHGRVTSAFIWPFSAGSRLRSIRRRPGSSPTAGASAGGRGLTREDIPAWIAYPIFRRTHADRGADAHNGLKRFAPSPLVSFGIWD